jgi:diguanylate cyclase (GGDEF)-like protein
VLPLPDLSHLTFDLVDSVVPSPSFIPADIQRPDPHLIYLLENDRHQAEEIASQIQNFGYIPSIFSEVNLLARAIESARPTAILIDISLLQSEDGEIKPAAALVQNLSASIPVLFTSGSDTFEARLWAIRSGGKGFFLKPLDTGGLVDALDRNVNRGSGQVSPWRVMIVDDSRTQASFAAIHLKKMGIESLVITDATQIFTHLNDFNPDLILLDMYMPEASGMEVANMIRQIEEFVSIPIVFLSTETDRDLQLQAMSLGCDDFLTKPIHPEHLISAVISRAERYRKLRSLMARDSLTGLYNNTAVNERLKQEMLRAERQRTPLSIAMIDLDHFKQVNDSWGHAAGDRVLKNLAGLFRQRLRRTDIPGRLGGEEFLLVLPDTAGREAAALLNELRNSFAGIIHRAGSAEFAATFSCGIACFSQHRVPGQISAAADQALYQAKSRGRNQVVLDE